MAMLHLGDIVEEIASRRHGKLANTRGPHGRTPSEWWVHFLDGNDPLTRLFFSEEELRLINCPHVDSERRWVA